MRRQYAVRPKDLLSVVAVFATIAICFNACDRCSQNKKAPYLTDTASVAPWMRDSDSTRSAKEEERIDYSLPTVLFVDADCVYHKNANCAKVAKTKHGAVAVKAVHLEDIDRKNSYYCSRCLSKYQIQSALNSDEVQQDVTQDSDYYSDEDDDED